MKKEIIKRIIVWVTTVVLLLAGGVTVATVIQNLPEEPEITVEYSLNTERFEGLITYGEEIDLSLITITKTENGVSTDIPVDISMVTTHVDTTRVGNATLELEYEGKEFFVPVTVKYRIQFKVDGEIVSTVHALTSSELKEVTPPQKEGYTFSGWSSDIPDVLYENLVLTPVYEADIPSLRAIDATYGDKLADITLPSSLAGAWRFDNAEGTVGNAGKRTFDVSFIENGTNAVLKTGKLTINVAKREVKIDVFADFTYNGTRQYPTYKTDVDVNVVSYSDQNNIDAGEYSYHFEVDDPNYTGEAKGTYVIKKAVVAVKINSYSIKANEAFPKAEYEVSGLEGMSKEEIVELIGLSIIYPDAVVVGEHKITAKASNPSIQLEVEEGTITVEQATFDGIGDPTPVVKVATYGDLLGSIEFSSHPNGKWVWETPEVKVGDVGKHTYPVIFIPSSSAFEEVRAEVEITVIPKPMKVEVVGNTIFDYDGKEHDIDFVVTDLDGTVREDLVVLGNASYKNAGSYTITLSFEDTNYAVFVDENNSSATKEVTLSIKKIDPVTDFEQVLTVIWSAALKLSDVELPEGYTWDDPDKRLETVGSDFYEVTFTPNDTENYNVKEGKIKVEVKRATATINNVKEIYEYTYEEGKTFTITDVTASNNGILEYTFEDGTLFEGVTNAGTYVVVITLPESPTYEKAEVRTTIVVSPKVNKDSVKFSQSVTYGNGKLVSDAIELPETTTGTWSILFADGTPIDENTTTIGDVGTKEFILHFTPATGNYYERNENITVKVDQMPVTPPKIQAEYASQPYTGAELFSGLENGEGYEIIEATNPVNVGTYTVTLRLVSGNYIWSDFSTEDKTVTYNIIRINNGWVEGKEPKTSNWEYGSAGIAASATPLAGTLKIEYKLKSAADSTYSTELPTQAGTYVARFTVTDDNYNTLSETREFTISKKKISVQYTQQYTYTGSPIIANIDKNDALYTISDEGHTAASDTAYFATLTLTNEAAKNYEWKDAVGSMTLRLPYYINKAEVGFSNLQISDYAFGGMPNPSVDRVFNITPNYLYYKDADCTEAIEITTSTPAGTYYVKAEFAGTTNLLASSIGPESFEITQATATIKGVKANKLYEATYDGNVFKITGVTASNGSELVYTYEDGVTPFAGVTNVGTYTVIITLPESHNYTGDSVTVTVKINPVENDDTFEPSYNVTYGDPISKLEEQLPDSEFGTWTIQETTVGDAGTGKTFTAEFTPYEQYKDNYAAKTQPITVNVAKAVINPSIADKVYNGTFQISGLDDDRYVVTEANDGQGGKNVGPYTVMLTLTDAAAKNYAWTTATNESRTIEVEYNIIKETELSFTNSINITGWIYGKYDATKNAYTPVVTNKTFANTLVEYQYSTDGGRTWNTWSNPEDFDAGSYKIRAIIVGTANYDKVEGEAKDFTVEKAGVIVPEYKTQYPYTGSDIEAEIPNSTLYEIAYTTGTNVADKPYATLTLKNTTNYKWVEKEGVDGKYGHSDPIKLDYEIVKADPELGGLTVSNCIFGEKPNPSVSANKFGVVVIYRYYYDEECEQEINLTTTPLNTLPVGTYWVKATFAGNPNISAGETQPLSFQITQTGASIGGVINGSTVSKGYRAEGYSFNDLFPNLKASHTETSLVYKVDGEVVDATTFKFVNVKANDGVYTVVITLPESHNYEEVFVTVKVKITPVANTDTFEPSYNVTYGDPISKLEEQLPDSEFGTWTIQETTVGNAGTGKTFTAEFTPYPEYVGNYATRTQPITVNVAKASVTIIDKDETTLPAESTDGRDYNGEAFGLPEEVKTSNGVNLDPVIEKRNAQGEYEPHTGAIETVGTYKVTYTYAGDSNHEDATATITVTIDPATIEFEDDLTVEKPAWTYTPGAVIPMPSVSLKQNAGATFVDVEEIYYQYQYSADNVTWTDWTRWAEATAPTTWSLRTTASAPAQAGYYRVRAVVDATADYGELTTPENEIVTFVINKAEVVVPTYTTQYPYKGVPIEIDIADTADYDIEYTPATNVANNLSVILKLADPTNYKWVKEDGVDGNYGHSNNITLYYDIVKANVNVSVGTVEWTYSEAIEIPAVTITKYFTNPEVVSYDLYYSTDNGTTWKLWNDEEISKLSAATYKVRAIVKGDTNYNGKTVDGIFKINPKQDSITGINLDKSYTTNYTGSAYTFAGLGADLNTKPEFSYAYKQGDGEWIDGTPTNHGTYTVKITLKDSTNYTGTSEEVTLVINKALNTDTITVDGDKAIYGNLVLDAIKLPTNNIHGTWSIEGVGADTTFASAGNGKIFVAVFTPHPQYADNYEGDIRELSINVKQANVTITDKDGNALPTTGGRPYNGGEFILPEGVKTSNGVNLDPVIEKKNAEGEYEPHTGAIETVGKYRITYNYTDANDNFADANATIIVTITEATVIVPAPSINGWEYDKYDADDNEPSLGDFTFKSELTITYKYYSDEDCTDEVEDIAAADVDTYWVKAIVTTTNTNLVIDATNAKKSFQIQKSTVPVPEYTDEYNFVIGDIPVEFLSELSTLYEIKGDIAKDGVKDYEMTLDLGTNFKNYDWIDAEGNIISKQEIKLAYKVIPSQVELVDLTTGWIYDAFNGIEPTVTVKLNGGVVTQIKPVFSYYKDEACTIPFTPDNKTPAGTEYWVKAVVGDTTNYYGDDLVAKFTIEKATPTIEGIDFNTVYGKVYDGTPYVFPNTIRGSYAGAPAVEYEEIINFCEERTVSITLPESDNYKSVTVTDVKVKIDKAENEQTITVGSASNFVYDALILSDITIKLPADVQGTWELRYNTVDGAVVAAGAKFTGIGNFTFWAVFTPDNVGNYEERKVEIPVVVGKAPVEVPTITNPTFDEQPHDSGIGDKEGYADEQYEIVEDLEHTAAGSYRVILKLKDVNHYQWTLTGNAFLSDENGNKVENADAEYVTIPYRIYALDDQYINATITPSWQYQLGQDSDYGSAQVGHGGYVIYYKLYADESVLPEDVVFEYSEAEKTRPTLPGTYVARFVTTDTNYAIEQETLKFTITAREITPPDLTSSHFPYTGDRDNPIKSGLTDGKDGDTVLYTIVGDNGNVNVNASGYTVYLQLANEYYVWDDGNDETIGTDNTNKSFTYYIDALKIIISGLNVDGWVYDPNATPNPSYSLNVPEADKNDVKVSFVYYDKNGNPVEDEDGNPTTPVAAGSYYVVATATPINNNKNLIASEETRSELFQITKAPTSITGADDGQVFNKPYQEGGFDITENGIAGIVTFGAAHNETAEFDIVATRGGVSGVKIDSAVIYNVKITLKESDNYQSKTIYITVNITPAEVPFDGDETQTITFGEAIALPNSPYGKWSIVEAITQAGENQKFTATFKSNSINYADSYVGVEITVTINPAPLTFSVSGDTSAPYTNGAFTTPTVKALSSITGRDTGMVPTITINGQKPEDIQDWSVGSYTVVYTFDGDNNYVSDSKSITFTVTPAQITFTGAPSIANGGWTYHPQNANLTAPSNTVVQTYAQGAVYFEYSFYDVNTKTWGEWTRWDVTAPKDAGDYKVRAVVPTDPADPISNYIGETSTEGSFKIDKDSTSITVDGTNIDKIYDGVVVPVPVGTVSNGVVLTPVLEKLNAAGQYVSYTDEIKNVGTYRITYSYAGDNNYYAAETQTITITISAAEIKFEEDLAIRVEGDQGGLVEKDEWTYDAGQTITMPTVSFIAEEEGKQYYSGVNASEVYFEYQYSADGLVWTDWTRWEDAEASVVATFALRSSGNAPKDAGFYKVRARVEHDVDVNESAVNYVNPEAVISEEITFEIKKAPVSITKPDGSALPETDTRPYNGNEYDIPAYEASFGVAVDVTVTFNGVVYKEDEFSTWTVWNFGTYTITYAFVDTTGNYENATETIEVTITQAEVTISKPVINDDGWKYGMPAREPGAVTFDQDFAKNYNGDIKFKYYSDKECTIEISKPDTSTPHGTYYVRAEFDEGLTHNIEATVSEATEFTIAQADTTINVGTITTNKDYDNVAVTLPTVTTHGVTLEPDVKKWNEETQKFDIPVGKNDIKAVGTYLVTYHYDGTNTNYVSQTETVEITIEQANIAFNGITIDGWTYDDYEGSEPTVSVDEKFEFVLDLVQYQYAEWNAETNAWGEWIDWTDETDPTSFKAGKYRIKAILENDANGNYTGDEITDAEAFEFDIEKADVTITAKVNGNTISDGATISKGYRPSGYTIAQIFESLTASNGATTFTYTVDGNGVGADEITFTDVIVDGEGVYTLLISLDESDNYKATSLTVKVKITPATNTDSFTEVYNNIPYNSNLWTTIGTLPAGWSIQNMDGTATNEETTVGNYGKNEFKLVFNNGNNYNPREAVTITINVERADASITVKVDDEAISNGDTITLPYQAGGYVLSDIFQITASHTEKALKFYVDDQEKDDTFTFTDVVRDGNENVGVYKLVIKLEASNNYDAAEITVYVKIEPVDGPEFIATSPYPATYGDNLWETVGILPAGWSIQYMDGTATNANTTVGDVTVEGNKFKVVFNPGKNYNSQDPVTITIKITPAEAIIDGANSVDDPYTKPYKGGAYTIEEIITGITEAHDEPLKYTLKDATSIEAATEYTVWIELDTDNAAYTGNYKIDGDKVVVKIKIEKVTIDITGITIDDWKYNEYNDEKPVATDNIPSFAENLIKYYYLYSDKADTWDDTKWVEWTDETDPTTFDAGYYKLKAVLANGGDNYVGDTFETEGVAFIVEKADATIEGVSNNKTYSNKYRGSAYTVADLFASITAKRGETTYTYTDLTYTYENGETFNGIQDFGTVKVVITLPESGNYKAATVTVTVSVTTATVELVDPAISWTFGAFNNAQPTVTIKLEGVDVTDPNLIPVTFSYYEDEACTKPITPGNTTPAGNYYVKALVTAAGNGNYGGDEAVKIFTVAKSNTASINGVIDDETISNNAEITLDYLPGGYSINDIFQSLSGSHTETMLEFKVGKDGVATTDTTFKFFTEGVIKNGDEIGAYELIITLPTSNTCNYEATSLTVYVKIMPIDNKDNFEKTSFNATFGDNIWDVLSENGVVLPTGWSIQYVDGTAINTDTTVGDVTAEGNKFYLVFDHGNNYNPRKEEIIFNVAPADGKLTNVANGDSFTGENGKGYRPEGYDIYDIVSNLGRNHTETADITTAYYKWNSTSGKFELLEGAEKITEIGMYQAVITLEASKNYDGDTATITIEITQAGVEFGDIDIDGWEYHPENENMQTPSVETTPAVSEEDLYFEYMYSADGKTWPETWTKWTVTAPAAVGYYRVRAVVDASDAYASAVSDYTGFQITIATVTKPTVTLDKDGYITFTYNDEVQKPNIGANDYYTITWSNENSEDYGTYTVTLTLIDTTNSKWNDDTTAPITYNYRINKAPVTITVNGSDVTKPYDGVVVTPPTATASNGATVSVLVNGKKPSEVTIKDQGTYTITYSVAESDNYLAATATVEVIINQATPTWTDPTFTGTLFENQFNPSTEGLAATINAGKTPVAGTFKYGTAKFADGENKSSVTLTFTPTDSKNFKSVTKTYYLTFVTVAYVKNANGETPYGSIEMALKNAFSGDEVWVRPSVGKEVHITGTIGTTTIGQGVTLVLPYYYENTWTKNTVASNGTIDVPNRSTEQYAKPADRNEATYCSLKVFVDYRVEIINKGTIMISGRLSGGSGAAQYSGFTAEHHAQLVLGQEAKITNQGTIYAAGFIREQSKDNGSTVVLVGIGSMLYQPFTVKDFPGGTVASGMYPTMGEDSNQPLTAFNRFILMNVSPTLHINYGGRVKAWAILWASDKNNQTVGDLIGYGKDNTSSVIALTDATYSYLTAKYDVDSEVCDLKVYGGAKTNGMSLVVNTGIPLVGPNLDGKLPIDTTQALFAISYHYNVTLDNNEEKGQTQAIFNMGQRFKVMTGATFTVEAGAKLSIDRVIVYEEFNDIRSDAPTNADGSDHPMRYPDKPAAIFTVNGELECNKFGGKIYSNTTGAKVTILTAASYTANETGKVSGTVMSAHERNPISLDAVLVGKNGYSDVTSPTVSAQYAYVDGWWGTPTYIEFKSNGGSEVSSVIAGDVYGNLPIPTREHYTFAGWADANGIVSSNTPLPSGSAGTTITLTAQWTPIPYTITFGGWRDEDGNVFTHTAPSGTVAFNATTTNIPWWSVTAPAGYAFGGWYLDSACTQPVTNLNGAALLAITKGSTTVYGRWIENPYTITYKGDKYTQGGKDITETYTQKELGSAAFPIFDNPNDADYFNRDQYFIGWLYNGTLITETTVKAFIENHSNNGATTEFELTAKWGTKAKVTFSYGTNPYGFSDPGYIWVVPGQIDITIDTYAKADETVNDHETKKQYYFNGWSITEGTGELKDGKVVAASTNIVVTANWGTKHKITVAKSGTYTTDYNVTISGTNYDITISNRADEVWLKPGETIKIKTTSTAQSYTVAFVMTWYREIHVNIGGTITHNAHGTRPDQTLTAEATITTTQSGVTNVSFGNNKS